MIDVPVAKIPAPSVSESDTDPIGFGSLIVNQVEIVDNIQSSILGGDNSFETLGKLNQQIDLLEKLQNLKFAENRTQQTVVPGRFMGVGAIGKLG